MVWTKRYIGFFFAVLVARIGILSLLNEQSFGYGIGRGGFDTTYTVYGWKAYVMGIGWLGAAVSIFSYFCLGEKLEKQKWNQVGASFGLIIFGLCLCLVATVTVINVFSRSAL